VSDVVADLQRGTAEAARAYEALVAKGYPEQQARAAVARARGVAWHNTRDLSAGIRGQGYLDTLLAELARAEGWLVRTRNGSTSVEAGHGGG
jgi:hypothetical protein